MSTQRLPRLIFASSDASADMFYATRISIPDPFLFLQQNGKTTLLLSNLEVDRGRKEAKVDEIVAYSDIEESLETKLKSKPTVEQTISSFLRQRRVKQALIPYDFPSGLAAALQSSGLKLHPVEGLFWSEREFKKPEEIKALQSAIRITEAGLARAMEVLRASEIRTGKRLVWSNRTLTSELLRFEIETAIRQEGGMPANTIVAGGDQACDPHHRGTGPLRANSLIILDVFPKDPRSGYYGDLTRTVLRGHASDAQRRLWATVLEGQKLALAGIKPDQSGEKLQDEISDFFEAQGYKKQIRDGRWVGFFHGLGHGLGLDIHEQPRIARTSFKPGQMLTVEPGLYFPGIGGVRIEDDGVVTQSGFKVLSRFPKILEI